MDNLNNILKNCMQNINREKKEEYIKTQYNDLDNTIGGGIHKGNVVVISGAKGIGKTTFALNIATNIVNQGISIAIFSLKLSKEMLINSILFEEAMVDIEKAEKSKLEDDEIKKINVVVEQLSEADIYLEDIPTIKLIDIENTCKKLKKEKNIQFILIDSLELLYNNEKLDDNKINIDYIMKNLKILSKELDISILTTTNFLSKRFEKRCIFAEDSKEPILSDLHKGIVKDADVIMFLHRDDFYNNYSEDKNIAKIIIAKNKYNYFRNDNIKLVFLDKYLKFVNFKRINFEQVDKDFEEERQMSFNQELLCLRKYTNLLANLNIHEIKQLEKFDTDDEIYILLNTGNLYCRNKLIAKNIDYLYSLEIYGVIYHYMIGKNNTILPIKQMEEWDDIDLYLYNNYETYKKIITYRGGIVCLTQNYDLKIISLYDCIGIVANNQTNIDDVILKSLENNREEIFIIKNGEEKPLFIR